MSRAEVPAAELPCCSSVPLSLRTAARSCRIKVVAFHAASWHGMGSAEDADLHPLPSGIVALPEELADAISDGQLTLFP